MKNKIYIIGGVVLVIIIAVFLYLKTLPNKILDAEIAKLNSRIGGEITYGDVEFNSILPNDIILRNFSFNKNSVYGDLKLSAKKAEIKLVDKQVDRIALSGVTLNTAPESSTAVAGMQANNAIKISTDKTVLLEVAENNGELIVIKFPQEFKMESPQSTSDVVYKGGSPILSIVYDKDSVLKILDYKDNGMNISTIYNIPGLEAVKQEAEMEPIKILYKKEEKDKVTNSLFQFKASLPKSSKANLDEISDLDEKKKKEIEDIFFFSSIGIDIDVNLTNSATSNMLSFIDLKKFNLIGDNFAIKLGYNGGALIPGGNFPNGSGSFVFENYQESLERLKNINAISQDLAANAPASSQIANLFTLAGSSSEDFGRTIDDIKDFFFEINSSTNVANFNAEYSFAPPVSFFVNDKSLQDLLIIWDQLNSKENNSKQDSKPKES